MTISSNFAQKISRFSFILLFDLGIVLSFSSRVSSEQMEYTTNVNRAAYKDCKSLQKHYNTVMKGNDRSIEFRGFEKTKMIIRPPRPGNDYGPGPAFCFGGYIIENSPRGMYVCLGSIVETQGNGIPNISILEWTWGDKSDNYGERESKYCRWRN